MKNRVLYISYDGMTDPLGQSQVLPYLKGLVQKGYNISLISFEKPERYEQLRQQIQAECEEHTIAWYPSVYTKTPPLLSTIKDVRKMRKTALKLHQREPFDIVHCRSYIAALVGLKMKRKFNTKFVFDMRGFWADERVEGGIWNRKHFIFNLAYSFFKKKELQFFKAADHVVSLTESGKNEILSWKSLENKTPDISVIPCCVDDVLFNPESINPHRKRKLKAALGIEEEHQVLGYVGSIGTWYMLDEMLDFFNVQLQKNNKLKFLFVTGESPQHILEKAVERNIPKEALIITSTSHKYVPLHISLFDCSIFFIRPTFSKKASSPTKQGELMAMGVPVICNSGVGDTDAIINKYNAGTVLQNLTDEEYKKIDLDQLNTDSKAIRNGAIDYFGLSKGVEMYAWIYQTVMK